MTIKEDDEKYPNDTIDDIDFDNLEEANNQLLRELEKKD